MKQFFLTRKRLDFFSFLVLISIIAYGANKTHDCLMKNASPSSIAWPRQVKKIIGSFNTVHSVQIQNGVFLMHVFSVYLPVGFRFSLVLLGLILDHLLVGNSLCKLLIVQDIADAVTSVFIISNFFVEIPRTKIARKKKKKKKL